MNEKRIKKVVVLGGGSAGWMTAAMLLRVLGKTIDVQLVESDEISTVGVGEATIPPIAQFNQMLGINEHDFMAATQGSYKLGIQFENWGAVGDSYMHAFGDVGKDLASVHFHHYWLHAKNNGHQSNFWDYSLNFQAALLGNVTKPNYQAQNAPSLAKAYHFDAGLYANYLRRYCESSGIRRTEGKVTSVVQNKQSEFIESLVLASGEIVEADLFVDCSGFSALLIEGTLQTGFEDWSHWLPCDRAIAIPTKSTDKVRPYTRSIAHSAGWQWNIPLQHRTGNGMVYSSKYLDDSAALALLMQNIEGDVLKEPNYIKFKTGRRKQQWNKNVVSIGLSSGFLEPLESTSLHLVQTAIFRLIRLFPRTSIQQSTVNEFNRQSTTELEHIRDFIILHYKLNQRGDSGFWNDCQNMSIPDNLQRKLSLFQRTAHVVRENEELFTPIAWYQVMLGQNLSPKDYHPMTDTVTHHQLFGYLDNIKGVVDNELSKFISHDDYLHNNCRHSD